MFSPRRDLVSLPDCFAVSSPHFVTLLAFDASQTDDSALQELAKHLLRSGCVFFSAWGPECERVHDAFDSVANFHEPLIMTTWHNDESLDDAIWNFVYVTSPDDEYWDTCRSALAISVGNLDWSAQIERRLKDLDSLNRDVLK